MNRITNGVIGLALKNQVFFSTAKKAKMELTIRTPYKTILDKFDGFSRIVAKTNEVIVISNKFTRQLLLFKIELLLQYTYYLQAL